MRLCMYNHRIFPFASLYSETSLIGYTIRKIRLANGDFRGGDFSVQKYLLKRIPPYENAFSGNGPYPIEEVRLYTIT